MLRRRPRARVVTTLAALACMLVTACAGPGEHESSRGSPSSAPPTPTPSPSPTGSPAPSEAVVEAPPQPLRGRRGPKGQRAFARFTMAAWSYALRTNDADPLLEASRSRKRPCEGCTTLAEELAVRADERWSVDFPGPTVRRIELGGHGRDRTAKAAVSIPESDTFYEDGRYRSTSLGHPDVTFTVGMRWDGDRYRLLSFRVS